MPDTALPPPGRFYMRGMNRILSRCYWPVPLYIGRLIGRISRILPPSLMFFFPCSNLGGSTRVHVDIVTAVADRKPWVILTTFPSSDDRFLAGFMKSARVFDFTQTPFRRFLIGFIMGFFVGVAENRKGSVVFGCNSVPYYRALPYFSDSTRRLDLLHYVLPDTFHESLPYVTLLDQRVIITPQTREHLLDQYRQYGIPLLYIKRVVLIENGVFLPLPPSRQRERKELKVVYVGRGSAEKRIHLIGRISCECARRKLPVVITLAGNQVMDFVAESDRPFCHWAGCITDDGLLSQLYRQADVIIMTSRAEGFPMVIMEAMAEGVVPLTTEALGGISCHIHDNENGFLVTAENEAEIVQDMMARLTLLVSAPELLERLSAAARQYAVEHFDIAKFCSQYRQLLVEYPGPDNGSYNL